MKKVITLIGVLLITASIVFAEEYIDYSNDYLYFDSSKKELPQEKTLTHGQVAFSGWFPYCTQMAGITANGLLTNEIASSATLLSSLLISDIPCMVIDPKYGFSMTGAVTGGFIVGCVTDFIFGNTLIGNKASSIITEWSFKTNMWIPYAGYQKARSMTDDSFYPEHETLKYTDLLISPFNPNVMKRTEVWMPLAISGGFFSTFYMANGFMNGWDGCIFDSKEAYIGEYKLNPVVGLSAVLAYSILGYVATGAGEEALFRGIGYEEMKCSFGLVPALIIDPVTFAAIHTPGDIKSSNGEINILSLLIGFTARGAITTALDNAYDKGGLRSSSALHMWYDTMVTVLNYIFEGGSPNNMNLQVSCSIPLN